MNTTLRTIFAIATVAILVGAAPAYAQATRTWVSGVGDDANPCSRTAPCKTFAGAISKTATAGEINCLDPGGFGAVTITKAISIICSMGTAGVLVSGTNGIIVNAPGTAKVLLEGLDIEGLGTGLNGVQILGVGSITIRKCSIRNFTQRAVNLAAAAGARAVIEDSMLINSAGGLNVGSAGVSNGAILRNSLIDNNTSFSVQVANTSVLVMGGSSLTGAPAAIATTAGASVVSYGNNLIRGTGLPTSTLPLQ